MRAINVLAITYPPLYGPVFKSTELSYGAEYYCGKKCAACGCECRKEVRPPRPGHIRSGYHFIGLVAIVNLNPQILNAVDAVFIYQVRAAFPLHRGLKFLS